MAPRVRRLLASSSILATATAVAVASLVSAAPQAVAADVLLSQGKPTTSSASGGANYAGANAVDGNSATRWASKGGVDPGWIYVDLGASANISRVRLQWDLSCAKTYKIETSANATSWTAVHTTAAGKGGVEDLTVVGSGRYVRMHGTVRCRTGAGFGYSLQEFQVFGSTGPVDSVPPSAPSNLRSTGVGDTTASLAWDASTDNVAVTSYDIYNNGQFVKSVPATPTSHTLTGLKPNTTYGFYVNARDAAGNVSQASNTVQVKTTGVSDTLPPSAPTNLRSTGVTANSVSLAWNASSDNIGVSRYEVYVGSTKVGDSTGTSTTVGGRSPNTSYTFTVKAFDAAGNASGASNAVTAKTTGGGDQIGEVKQLATDTDVPWGLAFLPDGSGLYSRRDAQDLVKITSAGAKTTVGKIPNVSGTAGEGGLLGIELSPTFAADNWVYVYHTSPSDNRVIRIKLVGNSLDQGSHQVLLTGIPRNKFHNGGRLRFGPDGKLYAATGDGQNTGTAQNKNSFGGKILRLNQDGSAPADNPFFSTGGNARYVWSFGHRNVQGLAFDGQGRLWQAELGDSNMDEVNLIEKGGNYGWPQCEGTAGSCGGTVAPKKTWSTGSASPSGLTVVNNAVYVAALKGERIYRLVITGSSLGSQTTHFQGTYGRIRTVEPAPDGSLWFTTSNGDKDSTANNSNTKILRAALN